MNEEDGATSTTTLTIKDSSNWEAETGDWGYYACYDNTTQCLHLCRASGKDGEGATGYGYCKLITEGSNTTLTWHYDSDIECTGGRLSN